MPQLTLLLLGRSVHLSWGAYKPSKWVILSIAGKGVVPVHRFLRMRAQNTDVLRMSSCGRRMLGLLMRSWRQDAELFILRSCGRRMRYRPPLTGRITPVV
jgi:hypothetical protein